MERAQDSTRISAIRTQDGGHFTWNEPTNCLVSTSSDLNRLHLSQICLWGKFVSGAAFNRTILVLTRGGLSTTEAPLRAEMPELWPRVDSLRFTASICRGRTALKSRQEMDVPQLYHMN